MKTPVLRLSLFLLGLVAVFSAAGCNSPSKKHDYETTATRFFIEANEGDAFASAVLPISGVRVAVSNKPFITELDIVHVDSAASDMGKYLVFQLTPSASRDLYRFTGDNQGKRVIAAINGVALGARQIDRPFDGGYIAIFVEMPDDQLPALIKNLNATCADIQKEIAKK
jgi:hypothetical protein